MNDQFLEENKEKHKNRKNKLKQDTYKQTLLQEEDLADRNEEQICIRREKKAAQMHQEAKYRISQMQIFVKERKEGEVEVKL